jgi:hypothetical protein
MTQYTFDTLALTVIFLLALAAGATLAAPIYGHGLVTAVVIFSLQFSIGIGLWGLYRTYVSTKSDQ